MRNSVDIAYFHVGETILDLGVKPTHLFVIIKGAVQQYIAEIVDRAHHRGGDVEADAADM